MAMVLMVIGGLWALLGAANIVGMFGKTDSEGILAFGLIFNMLLFVVPGLVVAGIGALLQKRRKDREEEEERRQRGERDRQRDIERRVKASVQQAPREQRSASGSNHPS